MSKIRLFWQMTAHVNVLLAAIVLLPVTAFGQSVVGQNTNAVGPTPEGFYRGIPHYQDNEPHCDRNPLLPNNIVCMANGYAGADDLIGDAWPRIFETQDNARTWLSRFATGSNADPATSMGLGFGADPIMVCFPGGCAGFFIASNRAAGGGTGGGVYMQLLPEFNIETGFRHLSEAGPRSVDLATGGTFLDKIDAAYLVDTNSPGTVPVTMTVEKGNGNTETITRQWPKGRFIVVFAAINASEQNIRIYSIYSDDYGQSWSNPKQVANTTGVDTGVAVSAIGDTVFYAYRQFEDSSGDIDAVYGAVSTDRGRTIRKPFPVVDNLCAFDQPTLPTAEDQSVVTSRTNNFVDVSNDGNKFVMVLAERLRNPVNNSCLTEPFNYPAGSRVLVTRAGSNGKGWSAPEPIAPRNGSDGPRNGHSFQFMPAVDCVLGVCQAIWYDTILDSIRNLTYLEGTPARNWADAADAFETFPLFGDFVYQLQSNGQFIQFRRTAEVYTRQFTLGGSGVNFVDPEPVRVTNFQRAAISPSEVVEVEKLPFSLKQYKGNTVSFMGDYIGLASKKLRENPSVPGTFVPNNSPDANNPALKASWFAYWTDTRNARGQLYTQNIEGAVPFEKTPTAGGMASIEPTEGEADVEEQLVSADKKLSAEGVEDVNPGALECMPLLNPPVPGQKLNAENNRNRIKDADVYGALIEVPATAWVLNASKGLGSLVPDPNNPSVQIPLQRTYTIAARNEEEALGKKFRFRIMNQPVGFSDDEARASWLQLPFDNFDNDATPPLEEVDEDVGPKSSVTVALFVVSALAVNPVDVNVYEVDALDNETLVETLTVDGALFAGDLVTPFGAPSDVNVEEIHNPFVYAPTEFLDIDYSNPDVWNPDVWNPDVWNPDVWNPDVWNPDVWNVGVTDASTLDNPEIPSPDVSGLEAEENLFAKFDVQFSAENIGNTNTPYTADFAANASIVRQLLATGDVRAQIIVWQEAELQSYQGCAEDVIALNSTNGEAITAGDNRILAVANNADLLGFEIPDITDNRKGSVTYYTEPGDKVQITVRFVALPETIRMIAPALAVPDSVSYVVTSQAANTGDLQLDVGEEQAILDGIPPDLTVNSPLPVVLAATRNTAGEIGAVLPIGLVTASKDGEPDPVVVCAPYELGVFAAIGLGTTPFTCSATSANTATGIIEFNVILEDQVPPVLGPLPANVTLQRETLNGAILSYTLPTATDNIDIDADIDVACSIAPGGVAPFIAPGPTQTEVVCTATDGSGNDSDTESFSVTVEDTTPPDLTIPASASGSATDPAGAAVTFNPVPSATDIGTVSLSCTAFDPAIEVESGDLFPIGTTTVECTATDDANNPTTDTFDVTVTDNAIIGSGLTSNKRSVKAGSVAGFNWAWENSSGDPVDVGENNQDIEAWSKNGSDCSIPGPDLINEDPGSSGIRRAPDGGWQFNWQTVYNTGGARDGEPLDPGQYCVSVVLMSDPSQRQTTEIRVRP